MGPKLKSWVVIGLLLGTAVYALAEDITLTTYYPSPRGVYQELKTAGNMVVGNISNAPGARLHVIQDDPASAVPVFRADDETTPDATPFIITSDGNVGIGIEPTQKLHVIGDARIEGTVSAQAFGSLSPLIFQVQGAERMRITDAGDIGIGTTSPGFKLDINGVVNAPDFFKNGVPFSVVPQGAVMFFATSPCPAGWTELAAAQGRYIVGVPAGGTVGGIPVGTTALSDLENRPTGEHVHEVQSSADGCLAGYAGACRPGMNPAGFNTNNTVSPPGISGTNAPYIQLLVCQKD